MRFLLLLAFLAHTRWGHTWLHTTIWPSPETVKTELEDHLTGTVIRPWNDSYYNWTLHKNLDHTRRAGAIVLVQTTEDIQRCVLFARQYNLRVVVRSSGHSYVGRSAGDHSLLISTEKMDSLSINTNDPESDTGASATLQSGTPWGNVYKEVDEHNLLAVGPSPLTVGAGGFLVGGGHSPMSRMLGLGVDSVISFTLVTAQGEIATVTATSTVVRKLDNTTDTIMNDDLFWAVRGGGVAFGVVSEFKIKLHQPPEAFVTVSIGLSIDHPFFGNTARDFFDFYGQFVTNNLTEKWGGYIFASNNPTPVTPDLEWWNNGTVSLFLVHFGGYEEAMSTIQPVIDWSMPGVLSVVTITNYTSFWDWKSTATDPVYIPVYIWNRFIQKDDLTSEFSEYFSGEEFKAAPSCTCTGTHLGGKTNRFPAESASVTPNFRSAVWSWSCGVGWGYPAEQPERMEQLKPFRDGFYKQFGSGVYYNEPDYHLENWAEEFWGANYGRLQAIKRQWDPENFFNCHMCVLP